MTDSLQNVNDRWKRIIINCMWDIKAYVLISKAKLDLRQVIIFVVK